MLQRKFAGSPSRTRTYDALINSQVFYRLNYRGILGDASHVQYESSTKLIILVQGLFVNNYLRVSL